MVDELVYGQSMASGTRMPNGLGPKDPRMVSPEESTNQLDNVCSTRYAEDLEEELMDKEREERLARNETEYALFKTRADQAWRYKCAEGAIDSQFYSCGDSAACRYKKNVQLVCLH